MDQMENEVAIIGYEYYSLAFQYLHRRLESLESNPCSYHPIRKSYWKDIPEGEYSSDEGVKLILDYLRCLESSISEIVSKNSIAYWIHLLRRISCTLVQCGDNRDNPLVILWVRSILEAAIQKYGSKEPCNRVGMSSELEINDILNGFFKKKNLEQAYTFLVEESSLNDSEKIQYKKFFMETADQMSKYVKYNSQLVLTDFGLDQLKEFYDLENLAFEVWRSGANIRGLNKGTSLIVRHYPFKVFEVNDDFVDVSINIFDDRRDSDFEDAFIAKGTYYSLNGNNVSFLTYVPVYNVGNVLTGESFETINKFFNKREVKVVKDVATNFIWIPLNMRNYYKSVLNYSEEFEKVNNINLESVLAVLVAILIQAMDNWSDLNPNYMYKYWQRAYEGPYTKDDISKIIKKYLTDSVNHLGLNEDVIDLEAGFLFWALIDNKRKDIDLAYPGPHSIFVPYGEDRLFIDYAWINSRLFYLFWNCELDDEKFKGTALELLIQSQAKMVLPTSPLKSHDGEQKQIDASFEKDDVLLIIECKAVGKSIGFERGDEEALSFRKKRYNEAIDQVDEAAKWLLRKKKGRNFDISKYRKIIPIVITPFIEYIRYDERKYWLSDNIPRILTPSELKELIKEDEFWESEENAIIIR